MKWRGLFGFGKRGSGSYTVQYTNFNPELYKDFPYIQKIDVREKGGIFLLDIFHTLEYTTDIVDDIGYDQVGGFIAVSWAACFDNLGRRVSEGGVRVVCSVKIYTARELRACYSETVNGRTTINFIPYSYLRFNDGRLNLI